MTTYDPIELLFGGMAKLAPGGDEHTRRVLGLLPERRFEVVVDAGCGAGRQTLVLARELRTPVDAVELHQPFLDDLERRAREAGLAELVRPHCMDMKDIPTRFPEIDLLWSEGAAYNIGFANALTTWAAAVKPGGFVVVSELSWLRDDAPDEAREFFTTEYPAMQSVEENVAAARAAGYEVLETLAFPDEAWTVGFYDVLRPRAAGLVDHVDPSVRQFAAEMVREIEVFERSEGSYGYGFFVLRRA